MSLPTNVGAAIQCRECGVTAGLDSRTAAMIADIAAFVHAHSAHHDVLVHVHLPDFQSALRINLMITDTGVYQWLGEVLIDHDGNEMCELVHRAVGPNAQPVWELTRADGAVEIHHSVTAAETAVMQLVQQRHPH